MRLLTSTMAALGFLYTGVAADSKLYAIEGVFCNTLEQIVQVIRTSDGVDTSAAIKTINAEAGKKVCGFAKFLSAEAVRKDMATYPYQEVANSFGSWQPLEISIVGIVTPFGMRYFRPRRAYMAFLKKFAIPGINI